MGNGSTERVTGRVADASEAAEAFMTLAEAEEVNIPTYARICRVIAARPELHSLLLEAPVGQRLPVLVLAALHDVVLRHPDLALAAWYPSVTDEDPSAEDPEAALVEAMRIHRDEIVDMVRHRQTQTNEVNRSCAWWWGATTVTRGDDRPLAVVELGASAGLNLRFDRYSYRFTSVGQVLECGDTASAVRLGAQVRGEIPDGLVAPLPDVVGRIGIDQHPLDPTDPDDRRWLTACVWPEQRRRGERLLAALDEASADPPTVRRGDVVDDLAEAVDAMPRGSHVLVLSSWVLAYLSRTRRAELGDELTRIASRVGAAGGRLSFLSLEAAHVVPWMDPPPDAPDAPAERRHASVLAWSSFDAGAPVAVPVVRAQAHLSWCEPLSGGGSPPGRPTG